ncbi:hypothetical protein [Nonomuraea typhae]|uniref:Uncharacterized protein n=1 Tax=Nonomuraea typhae TaxID=2603600 RepID=A0ABW7YX51_9ACTN
MASRLPDIAHRAYLMHSIIRDALVATRPPPVPAARLASMRA